MPKNKKRLSLLLSVIALILIVALLVLGCTGTTPAGWSGPAISGQTLFIGDSKGDLLALNVDNGTQRWAEQLAGPPGGGFGCFGPARSSSAVYGTPSVLGDLVFSTSYNGKAYAFNTADGKQKWVFPETGSLRSIVSGPAASGDTVIFGDTDGKIYALGAADGAQKWTFTTQGKVWSTPTIDGNTVYVASLEGRVYALNLASGSLVWKTGKVGGIMAMPVFTSNLVVVGSLDKNLYAFDKATGAEKWRFDQAGNFFWASPVLSGTLVIAANTDGNVYAVNTDSGSKVWVSPVNKLLSSTPTLAAGSIVVGGDDGNLVVLDLSTGNRVRSISAGTSIEGPLASQESKVFARARQGSNVYVKGFDISNGTSVLSAPLEAAVTQTPTGQTGQSTFSWQFIILMALLIVFMYLLFSRRRQPKP